MNPVPSRLAHRCHLNWLAGIYLAPLLALLHAAIAGAHLMPSGHARLNITENGIFAVFALGESSFAAADTDGDNVVSLTELDRYRNTLIATIERALWVEVDGERHAIEDVLLNPAHDHGETSAGVPAITVLGRFAVDASAAENLLLGVDYAVLDAGELDIRARGGETPGRASRILSRESSVLRLLPQASGSGDASSPGFDCYNFPITNGWAHGQGQQTALSF